MRIFDEIHLSIVIAMCALAASNEAVVICARCRNTGWVCEAHDDRPWDGPHACGCDAPGAMPELQPIRKRSPAVAACGLRAR
jgi:hypothetical protein